MILIVDSGATKAEWRLLLENGDVQAANTTGINPYFIRSESIGNILMNELPDNWIHESKIGKIYYYGAGCGSEIQEKSIEKALKAIFPEANLFISSDLLGAARALWQRDSGYTAILGTGSNAGYFNGQQIEKGIKSLGFILGDEGSGADLGKRLLKRYLEGKFNQDLAENFYQQFPFDLADFLDAIYSKPFPNRFMAGFVPFMKENSNEIEIQLIVEEAFDDFFGLVQTIAQSSFRTSIRFTGSVAWAFETILLGVAELHHFEVSLVVTHSIDLLVKFHHAQP